MLKVAKAETTNAMKGVYAMQKKAVRPATLEKPTRYNLGVTFGELVFTAGITGNDPLTGKIVEGGIGPQTRQTLENIDTILKAAGTSLENAIRVDAYLANVEDFPGYNEAYESFFGKVEIQPVRTTVVIDRFKGDAVIEITVIACKPS
jgi:2-iminobutanoate/2-iminopropanoate deaminase